DLLVHAPPELLREHGVTRAADVCDRPDAGRRRPVIAVAVVAGRRRKVVAFRQLSVVHALFVISELGSRQRRSVSPLVAAHMSRIGMARATRRRYVGRKDRGQRIVDGTNAVGAVAGRAGRYASVTLREAFAMDARRILGGLGHALARRVLPHELRVAVPTRATLDLRVPRERPADPASGIVAPLLLRCGPIAAVAIETAESVLPVDVLRNGRGLRKTVVRETCVTGDAAIDYSRLPALPPRRDGQDGE